MNDLTAGIQLLIDIIKYNRKHQDYIYVTTLAQTYFNVFTGSGIEAYLKEYRSSEDDLMFKQMMKIYETVIPSVVDNLDTIFEKPLRSNRVFSSIELNERDLREELVERMGGFWQGQTDAGVDAFLSERWKHDVMFDPNAFIAIEFKPFDPTKEKPRPFAIEYSSKEAINFNYIQGVLDWLLIEKAIAYRVRVGEGDQWKPGSKYIMYLDNQAIVFTEVDKDQKLTDIVDPVFVPIIDDQTKLPVRMFVQEVFDILSQRVPAFRVGYKTDPKTDKRTCVSNIHYALPFFKKEMKSGAELDLTIRGHVFPQKYMYGPKCVGTKDQPCHDGYKKDGKICDVCKGKGTLPVHTTSQDVIVVPLPTRGEEPILNLQQAMAYFSPPLDLVKFMEEYCDRLVIKARAAVFPSEDLTMQTQYQKTATEMDYSWDTRYDALRKFTAKYSYCWVFINMQNAIYLDIDITKLRLFHKFPADFKMKSASKLLQEGKEAEEANFPQHVKQAIHNDLAELYYGDDQDTLAKIKIKDKFLPFAGKSPTEVSVILMSADTLQLYKVIWIYFDIIFQTIDNTLGDQFYIKKYDDQKGIIEKEATDIIAKINAGRATPFLNPAVPAE